jgi:hypothetical protein
VGAAGNLGSHASENSRRRGEMRFFPRRGRQVGPCASRRWRQGSVGALNGGLTGVSSRSSSVLERIWRESNSLKYVELCTQLKPPTTTPLEINLMCVARSSTTLEFNNKKLFEIIQKLRSLSLFYCSFLRYLNFFRKILRKPLNLINE